MAIRAELHLGIRDFQGNLKRATADVKREADVMKKESSGIGGSMGSGIGGIMKGAVARFLPALAVGKVATDALSEAMNRQSQIAGLTGVSLENVSDQVERLQELAKLPGLGFDQAIQGSIKLQAVGQTAAEAESIIREMGNALALVGGGAQDLDGVILAITQIISKGKVSAEEINQIAERLPQVRALMKEAFGTADTDALQKMGIESEDFIEGLVSAAEGLERAGATSRTQLDNLKDSWQSLMVEVGIGADGMASKIYGALSAGIEGFENWIANVKESVSGIGSFISDMSVGGLDYAQEQLVDRETDAARKQAEADAELEAKRALKEADEEAAAAAKEQAAALEAEKEKVEELAKAHEKLAEIKKRVADKQLANMSESDQVAELKRREEALLAGSIANFPNFEQSVEGLKALAISRENTPGLPAEGINSAAEAWGYYEDALELSERRKDLETALAKDEADRAQKRADDLASARATAEAGGFALMTDEEQVADLKSRLGKALGIDVSSTGSIDGAIARQRKEVEDARAAGDTEAEKAALDRLNESQRLASEFYAAADSLAPDAPSGGVGSFAGLMNQVFGRDPQAQQLDELKRSGDLARDQRDRLDIIIGKMDDPPEPVTFGGS